MSAFLSSADTINALATYWALRAGTPGSYSTPADSLSRAIGASDRARGACQDPSKADAEVAAIADAADPFSAAFRILLLENQRSLEARYPEDADYRTAGPEYRPQRLPIVQYWICSRTTGELVGLLRGFEYQACEHDGWETSAAHEICSQIRRWLLADLETRDCGDNGSNWASWEAPEDPRAVAMRQALANA
jgi:hypothetical protein